MLVYKENHGKISRRILFSTLITLVVALFVFVGCNSKEKNEEKEENEAVVTNYTSALLERNNNIYIFDEDEEYLEGVGDLSRLKELTTLSNDWNKVAFKYLDEKDKVNIYSMKDEEYKVLAVENLGENQISSLSWIDNKLVVQLYVNPTTSKCLVYDSDTLELLNSCEGVLIDILDEGNTLVYGKTLNGITTIYFNDVKVLTLENKGEVLLKGKVSPKRDELAFITFIFDRENGHQYEYLYRGKVEDGKVKDVLKTIKPYEIDGEIIYEKDELFICSENKSYLVEEEKFIEKENEEVNKKLDENSRKLKAILRNTFESENIDESLSWAEIGVYNITWFAR